MRRIASSPDGREEGQDVSGERESSRVYRDEVEDLQNAIRLFGADSPEFIAIKESERPVIRLLMGDDDALHAPSAAMVYQFREAGLLGRQTRVAHLGEPVWAWR